MILFPVLIILDLVYSIWLVFFLIAFTLVSIYVTIAFSRFMYQESLVIDLRTELIYRIVGFTNRRTNIWDFKHVADFTVNKISDYGLSSMISVYLVLKNREKQLILLEKNNLIPECFTEFLQYWTEREKIATKCPSKELPEASYTKTVHLFENETLPEEFKTWDKLKFEIIDENYSYFESNYFPLYFKLSNLAFVGGIVLLIIVVFIQLIVAPEDPEILFFYAIGIGLLPLSIVIRHLKRYVIADRLSGRMSVETKLLGVSIPFIKTTTVEFSQVTIAKIREDLIIHTIEGGEYYKRWITLKFQNGNEWPILKFGYQTPPRYCVQQFNNWFKGSDLNPSITYDIFLDQYSYKAHHDI